MSRTWRCRSSAVRVPFEYSSMSIVRSVRFRAPLLGAGFFVALLKRRGLGRPQAVRRREPCNHGLSAENKTKPPAASAEGYIASRAEQQRVDCKELMA